MMNYKIRPIEKNEYQVLEDFIYEAIFIPEGAAAPPKSIIYRPELKLYFDGFGSGQHDIGLVAETEGKIVGAAWARIMNDYGHIDDETPSCAISLYKEYRNLGIGTKLMEEMMLALQNKGYKQVSLSVDKTNYAAKMYQKLGFQIVEEKNEDYIMVKHL